MAVESPDDLAIFADPGDFGVTALYAPRSGEAPYDVAGIFDEPSATFNPNRWPGHEYQLQEGAHLTSTEPTFGCRRADLKRGGKQGDRLTIGDTVWEVHEVKPDGTGWVVLALIDPGEDA